MDPQGSPLVLERLLDPRMPILLLTPCPYDRHFGGIQASARIAWEALIEQYGHRHVRMLSLGRNCDPTPAPEQAERWCASSKVGMACNALRGGLQVPLVLYWHLSFTKLSPLLARPGRQKQVVYLHGTECWDPNLPIRSQEGLDRMDLFLANSQHTWRKFLSVHPRFTGKPHRIVPLGIGEPLSEPPANADLPPRAVMIGRMDAGENYKGHRELIGIWPQVRASLPEAELVLIGGGSLKTELEELSRSRAGISFAGFVDEQRKQEILRNSRVLLLPSRNEGFGLVYLEAMRLGKPCLVSDADAGQEVVLPPEAGLAVDPSQPEDLLAAVLRLLRGEPGWGSEPGSALKPTSLALIFGSVSSKL